MASLGHNELNMNLTMKSLMEYIENNVCTQVTNRFSAHERVILVFISELRSNGGNEYQNNTRVNEKPFVTRVHTLFYFLHDKTNP